VNYFEKNIDKDKVYIIIQVDRQIAIKFKFNIEIYSPKRVRILQRMIASSRYSINKGRYKTGKTTCMAV